MSFIQQIKRWRAGKPTGRVFPCNSYSRARRLQRHVSLRSDQSLKIQGIFSVVNAAGFAVSYHFGSWIMVGCFGINVIQGAYWTIKGVQGYRDLWWALERLALLFEIQELHHELHPTTH